MAKAILELEMPESCWGCPLQAISPEKKIRYCTVMRYVLAGHRSEFEKLAVEAEEKYKKERHLYVSIKEILDAKAGQEVC